MGKTRKRLHSIAPDPKDPTVGWPTGANDPVNRLSWITRWGWTTGWMIFPLVALLFALNGQTHNAKALIIVWAVTVLIVLLRPMNPVKRGGMRMWIFWVAMEFFFCGLIVLITLFPNP